MKYTREDCGAMIQSGDKADFDKQVIALAIVNGASFCETTTIADALDHLNAKCAPKRCSFKVVKNSKSMIIIGASGRDFTLALTPNQ